MDVKKRYIIGVAVSILVGLVLGLAGLASSTHSAGTTTDNGLIAGHAPSPPHPVTLNTVDYALRVVADSVLTPDASRIGPGYSIIGVQLFKPQLVTTNTGVTWRNWGINFLISDRPFVNGTSMTTDFAGHLLVVMESVSPGILNSRGHATSLLAPQQVCQLFVNGTRNCTDVLTSPGQLIQIRNVWIVVTPKGPTADFAVDGISREIYISGDMSYQQMLALADSVIP